MHKNLLTAICLLLTAGMNSYAQEENKQTFTDFEQKHVRVATPGLFANGDKVEFRLDTLSEGKIVFPLKGGKVISAYGARRGHSGSDIKTKARDSILCVMDGVVRMVKRYGAYGEVIVVRHDCGLETVYSHNQKNFVRTGERVSAGQVIALTGRTGRATTEHLHFELRANGQAFNPNLLFDMSTGKPHRKILVCKRRNKSVSLQFKE